VVRRLLGRKRGRRSPGNLRRHGDRPQQHSAWRLLASSEGGMEIEEVAAHSPEKIHTVRIDRSPGWSSDAAQVARDIGMVPGCSAG